MNTCLASEPQIPVSRGRVTTQSGAGGDGSSTSTSFIGVVARARRRWLSGPGSGWGSPRTPHTSALIRGRLAVVGVVEVEATARIPLRALVAVGGDAAG